MEIYTVSFFGNTLICNYKEVYRPLMKKILGLMAAHEHVDFLVGCTGMLDIMASVIVHRVREEFDLNNCSLILVLPRMMKIYADNKELFEKYYDEIEICESSRAAGSLKSYRLCSRAVIDRSDLVISCIEHKSGSAFRSVEYAGKRNVEIFNVAASDLK